jgi:hypothetical protein
MTELLFGAVSALNTPIRGTTGTFTVSSNETGSSSTEVRYLLTHATLTDTGANSQLLRMLCPVREVFNLDELDFDEIMQRDINDARVAQELIPYLLDTKNAGHVKLFPPIVAVVVPLSSMSARPGKYYAPVVKSEEEIAGSQQFAKMRLVSGAPGAEHFAFEFYRDKATGREVENSATLTLASERCALAIVDGQHRAMALLALFRNLKNDWAQANRQAYEQYYKIWPKSEIEKFKLDDLQLPLIVCTFPGLDDANNTELDVVTAARNIFLTLNKNARQVSTSRNRLLDDNDVVSECLRKTLSTVKNYDAASASPLRIWNMELDQEGEASKIDSEVALCGVSHLYYVAQYLLFTGKQVTGPKPISSKGRPSTKLDEAFTRLGLDDEITADQRDLARRNNYTSHIADLITGRWEERYGRVFLALLSRFYPLACFARATLFLRAQLLDNRSVRAESLLFQGQSSARSYQRFKEMLDARRKEDSDPRWNAPHMEAVSKAFAHQIGECDDAIESMREERANLLLENLPSKGKVFRSADGRVIESLRQELDTLYSDVFTSVAFQAALLVTLTELVERPSLRSGEFLTVSDSDVDKYLEQLHAAFVPRTQAGLERFIAIFGSELKIEGGDISIVRTATSFRSLVYSAEMKPDAFPAYRYVLLEMLDRKSWEGAEDLEKEIDKARSDVLQGAYVRELNAHCVSLGIAPEKATRADREVVLNRVTQRYQRWLSIVVGRSVSVSAQRAALADLVLNS